MPKVPLSLPMSQIIASDAPLLSPTDSQGNWDMQQPLFSPTSDNFSYPYYTLPPSPPNSQGDHLPDSPVPATRMLKMRMTPDSSQDLCLPTHQLFDLTEPARPPTPPSRSPSLCADHSAPSGHISDASSCGAKRSASPAPSATKKRAVGERISSKDFVPPDVSGLSKREARLVKNRAAAFLSRQRKREEFECMEVRVAELEQENARLLALTQSGSSLSTPQHTTPDMHLLSEVEQLKAQLAAARERELSLSAQLASTSAIRDVPVKVEATEQFSLASPPRSTTSSLPSAHKSGASLGLMVLLCALPTLLSMRMQSPAPTSFAIPNPFPASSASAYDYNSFLPNDYDWSKTTTGGSLMDLDSDNRHHKVSTIRKLEFTGTDSPELGSLGDLDISFDTIPSDDGKIRVRIHPPSSSPSSRSGSPGASSFDAVKSEISQSSLAMWSGAEAESNLQASFSSQFSSLSSYSTSSSDPFLGVPSTDYSMPFSPDGTLRYGHVDGMSAALNYGQLSDPNFGLGSEYSIPDGTGAKRRVRIALKSMPQAGGEGGEWEVQIC
ncbi:hypothetical protein JR316_0002414 [Psilocybe cubensis]|uniref:BZIP domain-containing protein n=2 Tax=Psilocybe cubensis TaxID=181762 RepID=A0A8H8CPE9_PSICU|nr:hypothetical protein JR316_0002414 [Psilocybe cubensis]KAH9485506.1 hypothetical protein JR316_0002414 [Psilocybe cubensis]